MTSLLSNLVKRIDRLPKPYRTSDALQPLFEAVSNSIYAIQNKFKDSSGEDGEISINVRTNRKKDNVRISVSDNGTGLDKKNYEAFLTTDTPNKIKVGGKGVGRLLWLDAFDDISIRSRYISGEHYEERHFEFRLSNQDQILDKAVPKQEFPYETGTIVNFSGIRSNGYLEKFRQLYTSQNTQRVV